MKIGFEDAVRGVQTKIQLVRDGACASCARIGIRPRRPGQGLPDLRRDRTEAVPAAGSHEVLRVLPGLRRPRDDPGRRLRRMPRAGDGREDRNDQRPHPGRGGHRVQGPHSRERERRPERRSARRSLHPHRGDCPTACFSGKGPRSRSRSRSPCPRRRSGAKIDVPTLDGPLDDPHPAGDEIGPALPPPRGKGVPQPGGRAGATNSSK